ncbi:MAG: diguanylate cyclase [Defluviitaleaceae bacterium]|nr:diguanylate cyclase [Defluviitaleaceae bacterium]
MTGDYDFQRYEHTVTHETLAHIIDNVPMPCILRDCKYKWAHSNQAVSDMFALKDPKEFAENCDDLSPPYQPDGTPSISKFRVLMRDCLENGHTITFDWVHCRRDKELLPVEITLLRVDVSGKPHILQFMQDMRESHAARLAERVAKQRLQAMMDSCPIACGIVDEHFNIVEANNEVVNLFGILNKQSFIERFFELSPEYQPDGQLSRSKATDKLKQAYEAGRAHYEWLHQSIYGEQIPCEVTLVKVRLAEQDLAIIYIHDLRALKHSIAMMEKMQSIAYTDELTQLFSRRYFVENAEKALTRSKSEDEPFHLIMTDIDHFKGVNDTFGHPIGDEVLKIVAKRMNGVTRKDTVIARYGGEEFIVLLTDMTYDAAVNNAVRIQKAIEESAFMIKGMTLNITVSLGVATRTCATESLDDIIHMADVALYGAKRTGRNKVMEYVNAKDLNW